MIDTKIILMGNEIISLIQLLNRGQGTWTTAPQGFEAAAPTLYSRWERIVIFLRKRDADWENYIR